VVSIGAAFAVALALFTGTALAAAGGNGNANGGVGNGNGNGNEAHAAAQPAPTQPPAQTAPAVKPAKAAPAKQAPAHKTTPVKHTSTAGVKAPSATHNTSAPASSNQTKLYGNGKTAGQIATQAGYGSATLYGPGASQPHKANCGPHLVDVHALKHKKCSTEQTAEQHAAVTAAVHTAAVQTAAVHTAAVHTAAPTVVAPTVVAPTVVPSTTPATSTGEVLGTTVALAPPAHSSAPGVLGALHPLGQSVAAARLPFTGLDLWVVALAGLAVLLLGLAARHAGARRSTV
jgi:hypothetical protein